MQFTLTITLANDAMQTPRDIAQALDKIADDMAEGTAGFADDPITLGPETRIAGNVWDLNGNRVGSWKVVK